MPQKELGHMSYGGWRVVFVVVCGAWAGEAKIQHMLVQKQRYGNISVSTGWKCLISTLFYCWKELLCSKNKTDFVSQTLRRCRGSWRALTYVSGSGRHGSPPLSDKLVGVKTNLNDVVEQSQERSV